MRALRLAAASALVFFTAAPALAGGVVIKNPKEHLQYKVELEPHLDFGFLRYHGLGVDKADSTGGNPEFGGGFRATIPIMDPGFVPKINDSVGITFGIDLTGCPSYCSDHVRVRTPVGIQWAFHITREFDAFADLGGYLRISSAGVYPDFMAMLGARYLFSDKAALTLRIGYPFVSLGVSFFAG